MKKSAMVLVSLLLAGSMTVIWSAQQAQRAVADKLVRLHVLANSDSEEDQNLKLTVRDTVLAAAEGALAGCKSQEDAEAVLQKILPELEEAAEETLAVRGCSYNVSANISREIYPQRTYETFSLPAGEYLSLQVIIGEGEGRNWWCVVFPPLCLAATTEEVEQSAAQAGLNEDEITLITTENSETIVRFKILEWLSEWMGR